tara:strand:- start:1357 stop:1707 length:351 start_codon:yes stop_codon:yes gene_type:complete
MATWPATLPQYVLIDGFRQTQQPNKLRSTVDVGEAKMRPRSTRKIKRFQCSILISNDTQYDTLENFYDATLSQGTLTFDWVNPITQDAATFRFVGEVEYSPAGPQQSVASFELEEV